MRLLLLFMDVNDNVGHCVWLEWRHSLAYCMLEKACKSGKGIIGGSTIGCKQDQ